MFLGRVIAPGEPAWTDEDRDWALALLAYEADLCACGQPRSESMEKANEFAYRTEPLRCHACRAIAHGGEEFNQPGADSAGLFIRVTKTRSVHG